MGKYVIIGHLKPPSEVQQASEKLPRSQRTSKFVSAYDGGHSHLRLGHGNLGISS